MARKTQQEHLLQPEHEEDTLDWVSRMTILESEYGFLPTTNEERSVAFGAIPFENVRGGVGRHLAEIAINQAKQEVEHPDRAIRAVVRNMGKYLKDAINRRQSLLELYKEISGINPEIDIREQEDLPVLGLISVVQFHNIKKGIEAEDNRTLQGGVKYDKGKKRLMTAYDEETHDRITAEILMDDLPDPSVLAVRNLAVESGTSHRHRRDFWRRFLESSRSNLAANPIIDEILKDNS